ncbi:hypothetical protein BgiBS90_030697 [Biomphalaria glabrata]|nr:hypothetical protein BgiBS90_030697 [Biomphalaria glabrata]
MMNGLKLYVITDYFTCMEYLRHQDDLLIVLVLGMVFLTLIILAVKYKCRPNSIKHNAKSGETVHDLNLHDSCVVCCKNPGHKKFKQAKLFELKDLPEDYRRQDLIDYIRVITGLVVKVEVHEESKKRPQSLGKGRDILRENDINVGTGILWNAQRCYWRTSTPCPCPECKLSPNPYKQWGKLCVSTANHVVYDIVEARSVRVILNYDDPKDRSRVVTLRGYKVIRKKIESDSCELAVATHSKDVHDAVILGIESCYRNAREPSEQEKLTAMQRGDYLTLIISHPHGLEKNISLGRSKQRKVDDDSRTAVVPVTYTYDTPTCPGSSGAPVLIIGNENVTINFPPHSGNKRYNRNISGEGCELNDSFLSKDQQKSTIFFIIHSKSFNKKRKLYNLWRFFIVKGRHLYDTAVQRVKKLPKKRFRKPNAKMLKKLQENLFWNKRREKRKPKENTGTIPYFLKGLKLSSKHCIYKDMHAEFLQVKDFNINLLPKSGQDDLVVKAITNLCCLTGCLILPNDQFTCFIIYRDFSRRPKKATCPCPVCVQSKKPKPEWASFAARTSFNFANSKSTKLAKCILYYDDESQLDKAKFLYVYDVTKTNRQTRTCDILLATHDIDVSSKILKLIEELGKVETQLRTKFDKSLTDSLTVVPCHPHGLPKCLWIPPLRNDKGETDDSYNGDTCSGIAGAPVYKFNGQTLVNCDIIPYKVSQKS